MAFALHHLLFEAAERQPESVALRHGSSTLSFAGLAGNATRIAHALQAAGVRRGDRVGLYMHRGFDSMAGLYGISVAGAAYVALDSASPVAALAAVMDDCDLRVLLTDAAHTAKLETIAAEYPHLSLVIGAAEGASLPCSVRSYNEVYSDGSLIPPSVPTIENDLSLIFYTSGSTGKPKGVAHSHRSMLSNVEWATRKFSLAPDDCFAAVTSHHFDLSWFELFASMAAGGTLVMVPEGTVKFGASLAQVFEQEGISVWCSVPSVLVQLVDHGNLAERRFDALRWITFAGERFPIKHLRRLMTVLPGARYCNMYGTTETHIALYYDVPAPPDEEAGLPIGRPCAHVNAAVVGSGGSLVAPGETGELVIRGPSLMEGYWRLPERTATAVVTLRLAPQVEGRCYRTGDLVRLREDGNCEIIGRADRRIKVRGFLVDLDDVERVLLQHEGVREAAAYVCADTEDAPHRIGCSVVLRAGATTTDVELRQYAGSILPPYAVPDLVDVADDLPRTGSGKVSRRQLQVKVGAAAPTSVGTGAPSAPAADPIRAFLAQHAIGGQSLVLDDDLDLIEAGLVDSMTAVRLVTYLGETHAIQVPEHEFVVENFRSIAAIRALVERLRSAGAGT